MKSHKVMQDQELARTLSSLTPEQNELWIAHLRRLWEEGKATKAETRPAEEVLDLLERKYASMLESGAGARHGSSGRDTQPG